MDARHLLALAAVATLAAGCGDDDAPTPEPKRAASPPEFQGPREDRPACEALRQSDVAKIVRRTSGRELSDIGKVIVERTDGEEMSACGYFAGPHDDVAVKLVIDRAQNAQKRYWYRIEELNQRSANWNGPDPRLIRGVGQDKTYGGAGAFWVPSLSKLAAYRDDRMLTVIFFVPGVGDRESSAAAASVARTAYRRLFGDRPPAPPTSLSDRRPHA